MHRAASAAAGIGTVAEKRIIAGCTVIRMVTNPGPVTLVIGTHIPVIGTERPSRIKTAVGSLLAGVALRLRTGASRVYGTGPATAGIASVTEKHIITGSGVIRMRAGPRSVTLIIRTHIPVVGTDRT